MVGRRNVISGGLVAGLTGAFIAPDAAEAQPVAPEDTSEAAAKAVDRFREAFERQVSPATAEGSINQIRQQQRVFLRANQKYPDFIEVGLGVWEDVYDWHVRYQQPINATRLADGRYAMTFMFTNLILRPDQESGYVGFAFDNERRN
jgi:hypothetical protein